MTNILKNTISILQERFPRATITHKEYARLNQNTAEKMYKIWFVIAQDPVSGVKQRAIALLNLGLNNEIEPIAHNANVIFNELDAGIYIGSDNKLKRSGHPIDTTKMTFAPKIIIYTNKIHMPIQLILDTFSSQNILIEIINESEMYNTLFISYGGTDEQAADKINTYLKKHGIKTWFFPEDALPGEKLHRMMHDGINKHERVLCICSEQSLKRPGVLNELERVLEKEAKEGGSNILIPITLDDYVYSDWAPARADLANQIRTRVIMKVNIAHIDTEETQKQLQKLVKVLSKK